MTPPTLIRADYLIADPDKLDHAVIGDAALVISDGVIQAAGPWAELASRYAQLTPVLTGKNQLIIPGLVNAHHHGRAFDTRLMGMRDKPLELWLPGFILYPALDTYQETLLSALQMLRQPPFRPTRLPGRLSTTARVYWQRSRLTATLVCAWPLPQGTMTSTFWSTQMSAASPEHSHTRWRRR